MQSYVPRQPVKERKSCNNKVGNAEKQGPIPSIMPINAPEIASDLIQIMAGNRILGQAGPKGPKEQEPMRLTTRTNLAIRTLMYCAANPGVVVRKSDIAKACDASENHLGQVIHLLAQLKFIVTHRGRFGGMTLARASRNQHRRGVSQSGTGPALCRLPEPHCRQLPLGRGLSADRYSVRGARGLL